MPNGMAVDVEAILLCYCMFDVAQIPRLMLGGIRLSGAYAPAQRIIMVEATESLGRQRFSMAHELGHAEIQFRSLASGLSLFDAGAPATVYRCASEDVNDRSPEKAAKDLNETLANMFAARLLMPGGLVREAWRKSHSLKECAELLDVSREALGYRLDALGLRA